MKKILSLLLVLASLLTVVSCAKYDPVESTKEESKVVMTMSFGYEEYEIKYELYRALFLNHKSEVDGGDNSVWTGADRASYIEKINKIIVKDAAKIFAAIYVCHVGVDYDVYSSGADDLVEKYVEESVEGTDEMPGWGTYEAYLAYLKRSNLNYSVQDLMFRYYIALDKIGEYYAGSADEEVTDEDDIVYPYFDTPIDKVRAFYYSPDFKRVQYAYFSDSTVVDPEEVRAEMLDKKDDGMEAIEFVIGGKTATPGSDAKTGIFLPKYSFNNELYDVITSTAFALDAGEVSEIISVSGTGESTVDGKYILYAIEKNEADFEKYYYQVRVAYLENLMGSMLRAHADALANSVRFAPDYSSINHSSISM